MGFADSHFARVTPVVGAGLRERRVGLMGCAGGAEVAALLAASGVMRWALAASAPAAPGSPLARRFGPAYTRQAASTALAAALRAHHGERLPWAFVPLAKVGYDLLIAAGEGASADYALAIAARRACPLLLLPANPRPDPGSWAVGFPVARVPAEVEAYFTPDPFAAAAIARALLLRGTAHARPDIEALLAAAPLSAVPPAPAAAVHSAPDLRGRTALVAGLGGLGCFVALELGRRAGRLVIADGDEVAPADPALELYRSAQVGRPKAEALAEQLRVILGPEAPEIVPVAADLRHEEVVAGLAANEGVNLAVLAAGGPADLALSRGLLSAGVPHLAARCHHQARFWEVALVPAGGAAAADMRSAPEETGGGAATLVEVGWAASCVAALASQMLAPAELQEAWFIELLAGGATRLLGGAYVEEASGVDRPGQVRAHVGGTD